MKVFDRTIETKENQIAVWGLEKLLAGLGIDFNLGVSLQDGDVEEKQSITSQNEVVGEIFNTAFEEDDWEILDEVQKPLVVDAEQDMMREMIEVQRQEAKPTENSFDPLSED